MDKNTRKILNFLNSHPNEFYSPATVLKIFPNLNPKDILEILNFLSTNNYVRVVSNNLYQSTNKGKNYKSVNRKKWISNHIVAVLALIVSIFAFIESTISLIVTIYNKQ